MEQDNNYYGQENDPYWDKAKNILKNKLSITNEEILENVEKDIVEASYIHCLSHGKFDIRRENLNSEFLKKIHSLLFIEVYDWAGKYRTVRLTKGQSAPFCYPENIANEVDKICYELRKFPNNLDIEEYIFRISNCYNELNAIHPFREGNGRTQRTFFQSLVKTDNYILDFSKIEFEEYTARVIKAYNHVDHTVLIPIFEKCLIKDNTG